MSLARVFFPAVKGLGKLTFLPLGSVYVEALPGVLLDPASQRMFSTAETVDLMEPVKGAAKSLDDLALRVAIEEVTEEGALDRGVVADLLSEVAISLTSDIEGAFKVAARLSEHTDVVYIDGDGVPRHKIKKFQELSNAFHRATGGAHLRPIDQLNRCLQRDSANREVYIRNYLERGYNINTVMIYPRADNTLGETPLLNLLIAQEYYAQDSLDVLLKYSFTFKTLDVNTRDSEEKTGFTLAAKMRNSDLMRRFLDNADKLLTPIDVNAQDKDGRSAMHYAYLYGDKVMIHLLREAGAQLDILDKDGRTPEDLLRLDIADSVKEVVSTLASIEIDVYRPEHARYNADTKCSDTGKTLLDQIKDQRREALALLTDVSKGKGV
jgi:hypothetical protein